MVTHQQTDEASVEPIRIGVAHPQYAAVLNKRFKKRFTARPDYVRLASSTEQVVTAVQEAVDDRQRLVVTSGGPVPGDACDGALIHHPTSTSRTRRLRLQPQGAHQHEAKEHDLPLVRQGRA